MWVSLCRIEPANGCDILSPCNWPNSRPCFTRCRDRKSCWRWNFFTVNSPGKRSRERPRSHRPGHMILARSTPKCWPYRALSRPALKPGKATWNSCWPGTGESPAGSQCSARRGAAAVAALLGFRPGPELCPTGRNHGGDSRPRGHDAFLCAPLNLGAGSCRNDHGLVVATLRNRPDRQGRAGGGARLTDAGL